jgi:hypothetical protein
VRGGYDIARTRVRRDPQHFERLFQTFRAVIQSRKDMAVDIDKVQINISSSCVA